MVEFVTWFSVLIGAGEEVGFSDAVEEVGIIDVVEVVDGASGVVVGISWAVDGTYNVGYGWTYVDD